MSWKEKPQEEWGDEEFDGAATWVLNTLGLTEGYRGYVEGLLETYGPEDITHEHVEEMVRL